MSTLKKKSAIKSGYHHGDLLNDLKKTAIKMINTKGLAKLNLRELAVKCGVSATSVYRHYESKEHLLAAIAEDGFHQLQQSMLSAQEPHKLQAIGIAYIQFALQNPVHFQLMFGALLDKNKHPLLLNASQNTYQILRAQIAVGIQQGIMVGDIDSLARTAWATVHGTAMLLLDKQFTFDKSKKIDASDIAMEVTTVLGAGLFIH